VESVNFFNEILILFQKPMPTSQRALYIAAHRRPMKRPVQAGGGWDNTDGILRTAGTSPQARGLKVFNPGV
jgi:hypothetical protein